MAALVCLFSLFLIFDHFRRNVFFSFRYKNNHNKRANCFTSHHMGQLLTKLLGGGGGRQTAAITTPRFGDDENEDAEDELCTPLWLLVRRYPDVWGEVLKHLNTTDIKFLYDVNRESRFVIRRQGYVVRDTKFRISEFSSVSTLEFAWENIPRK